MYGTQEAQGGVLVDGHGKGVGALEDKAHVGLCDPIFGLYLGGEDVEVDADVLLVLGGKGTHGTGFAGDGIVEVSTGDFAQVEVVLVERLQQEAVEQLVGIGKALVDVVATMSARKATQLDGEVEIALGHGHGLIGEGGIGAASACTSDEDFALVLAIEIEQDIAVHESALKGKGAGEARLLVHGEEALQGAMLDGGGGQYGQGCSHTDAVVGSQGGAACTQPFAIDVGLDGVGVEVVADVLVLLAHHVDVRLQDYGLMPLHAGGGGFLDEHVSGCIHEGLQLVLLAESTQVGNNLLLLLGRTGHLTNLIEVRKDFYGFQIFHFHIYYKVFS